MLILMLEKVNFEGDFDDDGHPNHDDAFPKDRTEWLDSDGDDIGDNADTDDDGDGVSNLDEIRAGTDPGVADKGHANLTTRPDMLSLPLIIDYVLRKRAEAGR